MATRTAADIVTHALRDIGNLSTYDDAADPLAFEIALERFDMLLAEMVGTNRLWWFVPVRESFNLTKDVADYKLNAMVTTKYEFIDDVFLLRNGEEERITLIRQERYDELKNDGTAQNTVCAAYVERDDDPYIRLIGAPQEDGLKLVLRGRTYSEDVTNDNGAVEEGFPKAWERCLVKILAADLGDGPITTLPDNEIKRKSAAGRTAERRLRVYHNKENVRKMRHTATRRF